MYDPKYLRQQAVGSPFHRGAINSYGMKKYVTVAAGPSITCLVFDSSPFAADLGLLG